MMASDPRVRRGASLSERLYARLLLVYPPGYRRQYGPLMLQLFRDQYRDARGKGSRWASWQLWWRIASELAETAAQEHLAALEEALMDKQTGRLNVNAARTASIVVAGLLIAGSLIGRMLIFEFGGSPLLAVALLIGAHLVAGLIIDRMMAARGTAFLLMALIIGSTFVPLLWVPDGAAWLRENPPLGGIFVVILAGAQPGRARWPHYVAVGILAVAQIAVSFL
jgi:hypothetical protein